jgi:cell wall-associated NlpC family hydrolase
VSKSLDDAIADEAIEWIDTPFLWDQSVKGRGCDCKGLLAGVLRELERPEAESLYATMRGYRVDRPVPSSLLLEGFERLFDRTDELARGRLLLLNHAGQPGHMAISVGNDRAVHAFPGIRSAVRERDLAVLFHKYPLHSVWKVRTCP